MRKALGRGLDALLPQDQKNKGLDGKDRQEIRRVSVSSIKPNHLQPRKNFDPERLSELAQSIKEHGLAQPITVSFDSISNSYELIAGERRLRAAKLAGLTEIDAVVRTPKSDKERLALALVENIQRDDLNAIETARAYRQLMKDFSISQTDLSRVVGKSKPAVSNTLRLLDLPEKMQEAVEFEKLFEGHARALLMVEDAVERDKLFKLAVERSMSVRDVEALAKQVQGGKKISLGAAPKGTPRKVPKTADIKALETELARAFGTRVEIRTRSDNKSGRVVIHFYSLGDFDHILKIIKK
ncbi:MAG: ParB/RepB/Spo0J family partition protein [Elusimicrobiota bacterium]